MPEARNILAVLGPTNTGKTFLAIDRMLGHQTGMIGFPLRLLARENYDRVCSLRGAGTAALITGEERIVPPNPRYYLCTVEAMPIDRRVAFLAVDEIQLCADPERGHIFTQRLLHARGKDETMFLGAATATGLVKRLVPEARFTGRPRFSELRYAGVRKLSRLPPRSAVIGFSAAKVYELAEKVRRQRGGAAVVLGALSPRTRNAQVAMYEAGEVDYLVATDAIGMGLNMAIDHVVFSSLRKFDGHSPRALSPAEIGQIAGRAGRHMADGTFGLLADIKPPDSEVIDAVETHSFDALQAFRWRNSALDFASPRALRNSLAQRPPKRGLVPARAADDIRALDLLMQRPDIVGLAASPDRVRILWDACQIPDFRQTMSESHAQFVARVFRFLMTDPGVIPEDWAARAMARLDRTDGDIDTLIGRIAHIRTWTYVSHRDTWLKDATHWQERTRAIEDKLSDTLHQRLAQRFVDRKTAAAVQRLRSGEPLLAGVTKAGKVVVEGEEFGSIAGFRFTTGRVRNGGQDALMTAAHRVLQDHMRVRAAVCATADDQAFTLVDGRIEWDGAPIAELKHGNTVRRPNIRMLPSEFLGANESRQIRARLQGWLTALIESRLRPLARLEAAQLSGAGRGLAYELCEGLGAVPRRRLAAQIAALEPAERAKLRRLGVRFGRQTIYLAGLLPPRAVELRRALWAAHHRGAAALPAATDGGITCHVVPSVPAESYLSIGYVVAGPVAVRVDRLEALIRQLTRFARQGAYQASAADMAIIKTDASTFAAVVEAAGFIVERDAETVTVRLRGRGRNGRRRPPRNRRNTDSPFARLRDLQLAR